MHAETRRLADLLHQASHVRLFSAREVELTFSIAGCKALCSSGPAQRGDSDGLPTGEDAIAPVEGTAEDVVVVDHEAHGLDKLLSPIKLFITQGRIISIEGEKEAKRLKEIIAESNEVIV